MRKRRDAPHVELIAPCAFLLPINFRNGDDERIKKPKGAKTHGVFNEEIVWNLERVEPREIMPMHSLQAIEGQPDGG